jgi:hypothetical protein
MSPAKTTDPGKVTLPARNITIQVAFMLSRKDSTKALVNVEIAAGTRMC